MINAGLTSYLYVSRVDPGADLAEVAEITRRSRVRNKADDISGVLVFDGEAFAQYLEGPPVALALLRQRIAGDRRHKDLDELWFGPQDGGRRFPNWQLGYLIAEAGRDGLERLRGQRGSKALRTFETMLPELDVGSGAATSPL